MKKVALVFVLAVLAPSLVLAWLAVRSLRDQQFLLERQQSLLDQRVTDTLAQNISDYLAQQQQAFSAQVESLAAAADPKILAAQFDEQLRQHWPLAEVGFCVTAAGKILSPLPNARPAAQMFRLDNSSFLGNREPVEVYFNANNPNANANANVGNAVANSSWNFGRGQANQSPLVLNNSSANSTDLTPPPQRQQPATGEAPGIPNSSAPPPQNLASANSGEFYRRAGANGFGRNVAASTGTMASNGNPIAYAGNAGVNSSLNSGRGQANQVAFAINNGYANAAIPAQQPPRQQLKSAARSTAPGAFTPSQAFAISDGFGGADGGGGKDALLSDSAAPSATTRNPVFANSSLPTQPPETPQLATAKALSEPPPAAETAPQPKLALDDSDAQKE